MIHNKSMKQASACAHEPVPAGEYEVFVRSARFDITPGGSERIAIGLMIRSDVEQLFKGRMIYVSLWLSPRTAKLIARQLGQINAAVGITQDMRFETEDEWGDAIIGSFMRVTVTKTTLDGHGAINAVRRWAATRAPQPQGDIVGYDRLERNLIDG